MRHVTQVVSRSRARLGPTEFTWLRIFVVLSD
jgi:hypothetical protein